MKILITGGAGFIGSAFVRIALERGHQAIVLDALTYAGHRDNLSDVESRIEFVHGDIRDGELVGSVLAKHQVDAVVNFAAESHVDNSISGPKAFLETNIMGTYELLERSLRYWRGLAAEAKAKFRYLQVSTDEVFGQLGAEGQFTEESPYAPNSPYSASKAAADHLVRAWHHTYGLPTLLTNCSNNYGPRQFPEKLIPVMIQSCLKGRPLPVYGQGLNVRDWIHVEDHAAGVLLALEKGVLGESYCFGGNSERTNLEVVKTICALMDEMRPQGAPHSKLISFVTDRAGHDWRYAIDDRKAVEELGFKRRFANFETGLRETVLWYLDHQSWVQKVSSKGAKS